MSTDRVVLSFMQKAGDYFYWSGLFFSFSLHLCKRFRNQSGQTYLLNFPEF